MQHRIGLDIRMLQNTGIGTYLQGLLAGFRELNLPKDFDLALFGKKDALSNTLKRDASWANWPQYDFSAPIYSVHEQVLYPKMLRPCRLWHAPHYNIPLQKGRTKLVVTIHDIIHWIFRKKFFSPLQGFYSDFMLKKAVQTADHIIAVSHHTKKDLIKHFRAREKNITVIHESADARYHEMKPEELSVAFELLQKKYAVPASFFLYVGLLKPHKNVLWLIRIFQKLKRQGKIRTPLVLIGRKDKKYPSGYEELEKLESTPDIIHIPVIEPGEIIVFYNQALALVHPSLYEGFGLTLLEAMRCGTPVLTSNASSIPEVVGDAVYKVDPSSEAEMTKALIRLEHDAGLRESFRIKGLAHVQLFSWKETARQTAAVYEKVLAEK